MSHFFAATPAVNGVLETVAGALTLDEIARVLDGLWAQYARVPDQVRVQVSIAVWEIAANIVEHAGRGRPIRIRMEVFVLADEVRVEFVDNGLPAQVDLSSVAMPDAMAERGRGLALAKATLERLHYCRAAVNHWALVSKSFC